MSKRNVQACKFGAIKLSSFEPAWGLSNGHCQTIYPRYFVKHPDVKTAKERIATTDGDFLDLAWSIPRSKQSPKSVAVIFHGLQGSVDSHYAKHAIHALCEENYIVVLMHFRGCSQAPNMTPRAYHSGEVEDPIMILNHVKQRYPHLPICAVGFSLGGNMLMNLLAEHSDRVSLSTAIAISSPLNLSACARKMDTGFSRVYQAHLIKSMQANLIAKMKNVDMRGALGLNQESIRRLNTFYAFDDEITAPLHGFTGAQDYYQRCSALPKLSKIHTPTLIIHAKDDPFMNHEVVPTREQLSDSVAYEVSEHGGHVGFLSGSIVKPKLWLNQRIVGHFNYIIEG